MTDDLYMKNMQKERCWRDWISSQNLSYFISMSSNYNASKKQVFDNMSSLLKLLNKKIYNTNTIKLSGFMIFEQSSMTSKADYHAHILLNRMNNLKNKKDSFYKIFTDVNNKLIGYSANTLYNFNIKVVSDKMGIADYCTKTFKMNDWNADFIYPINKDGIGSPASILYK